VPDTLYNATPVDQLSYVDPESQSGLLGETPPRVLDLWMAEADRQGMYMLLDFHGISKPRQYPHMVRCESDGFRPELRQSGVHAGRLDA
jgi:hypothetical protein